MYEEADARFAEETGTGAGGLLRENLEQAALRPTRGTVHAEDAIQSRPRRVRLKRRRREHIKPSTWACAFLAGSLQTSTAQSCVSLKNSKECSAFNASSVSTDSSLVGLFPFLSSVSDTKSFDSGLKSYISNGWAQVKYVSTSSAKTTHC